MLQSVQRIDAAARATTTRLFSTLDRSKIATLAAPHGRFAAAIASMAPPATFPGRPRSGSGPAATAIAARAGGPGFRGRGSGGGGRNPDHHAGGGRP